MQLTCACVFTEGEVAKQSVMLVRGAVRARSLGVGRCSLLVVARRHMSIMSSDMSPAELVPPGSDFVCAMDAFTQHKLLGNRAGFCWRTDRSPEAGEPRFHYDQVRGGGNGWLCVAHKQNRFQAVAHVVFKSPFTTDRFARIDFQRHAVSFLEVPHKGVTEANYRAKWAAVLKQQGHDEDVETVMNRMEEMAVKNSNVSLEQTIMDAKKRDPNANLFLLVRGLTEMQRTVVVPGAWLSALKSVPWPNAKVRMQDLSWKDLP